MALKTPAMKLTVQRVFNSDGMFGHIRSAETQALTLQTLMQITPDVIVHVPEDIEPEENEDIEDIVAALNINDETRRQTVTNHQTMHYWASEMTGE